jgi:hypothetical protein
MQTKKSLFWQQDGNLKVVGLVQRRDKFELETKFFPQS